MSKTPELLPCPFCGEEAELVRHECGFYVECTCCAIISPADSLEASIKFWNARVYQPEVQAAIDLYTPKKPLNQFKRYGKQRGYCPSCDRILDDQFSDIACRCGQRLDWSDHD